MALVLQQHFRFNEESARQGNRCLIVSRLPRACDLLPHASRTPPRAISHDTRGTPNTTRPEWGPRRRVAAALFRRPWSYGYKVPGKMVKIPVKVGCLLHDERPEQWRGEYSYTTTSMYEGKGEYSYTTTSMYEGKGGYSYTTTSMYEGKGEYSYTTTSMYEGKGGYSYTTTSMYEGEGDTVTPPPPCTRGRGNTVTPPPQCTRRRGDTVTPPPQCTRRRGGYSYTTTSMYEGKGEYSYTTTSMYEEKGGYSYTTTSMYEGKGEYSYTTTSMYEGKGEYSYTTTSMYEEKGGYSYTTTSMYEGKGEYSYTTTSMYEGEGDTVTPPPPWEGGYSYTTTSMYEGKGEYSYTTTSMYEGKGGYRYTTTSMYEGKGGYSYTTTSMYEGEGGTVTPPPPCTRGRGVQLHHHLHVRGGGGYSYTTTSMYEGEGDTVTPPPPCTRGRGIQLHHHLHVRGEGGDTVTPPPPCTRGRGIQLHHHLHVRGGGGYSYTTTSMYEGEGDAVTPPPPCTRGRGEYSYTTTSMYEGEGDTVTPPPPCTRGRGIQLHHHLHVRGGGGYSYTTASMYEEKGGIQLHHHLHVRGGGGYSYTTTSMYEGEGDTVTPPPPCTRGRGIQLHHHLHVRGEGGIQFHNHLHVRGGYSYTTTSMYEGEGDTVTPPPPWGGGYSYTTASMYEGKGGIQLHHHLHVRGGGGYSYTTTSMYEGEGDTVTPPPPCTRGRGIQLHHHLHVQVGYPLVGHTHEHVDQFFSKISSTLQKQDATTVEELIHAIKNSFPNVKTWELEAILDVKAFLGDDFASDEEWKPPINNEVRLVEQLPPPNTKPELVKPRIERLDIEHGAEALWQSGKLYHSEITFESRGVHMLSSQSENRKATRSKLLETSRVTLMAEAPPPQNTNILILGHSFVARLHSFLQRRTVTASGREIDQSFWCDNCSFTFRFVPGCTKSKLWPHIVEPQPHFGPLPTAVCHYVKSSQERKQTGSLEAQERNKRNIVSTLWPEQQMRAWTEDRPTPPPQLTQEDRNRIDSLYKSYTKSNKTRQISRCNFISFRRTTKPHVVYKERELNAKLEEGKADPPWTGLPPRLRTGGTQ
ncbi:hypothetical protein Bbelb_051090 [Branchiostoma belcheri]|nr:hypothetical protein Bbelb_051090 [Branchiostoma belcheri]